MSDLREKSTNLSSPPSMTTWDPNKSFRHNLQLLLHSYRFQIFIVVLVVIDCIVVVTESLIDLQIYRNEYNTTHTRDISEYHKTAHSISEVLQYISIAILVIFTIEIVLKVFAFRCEFFKNPFELFDAIIVITSLGLDIIFSQNADMKRYISLMIVLRLWRVIRVVHGIIISVRMPLEAVISSNLVIQRQHNLGKCCSYGN
ncbi:unnamed protein product [Medioppia subpectinata]|uniref:Voltage-gated hydrogen channel 1 n=1 Tax=Medioppia subpectinata TaxID=1979941 RepID=A0A7R9KT62_9ACAR|nr:unnamed protein product [Medioppia subpectinata]CAG2109349.1 unnamed protein product [Medioppia subpectinata]